MIGTVGNFLELNDLIFFLHFKFEAGKSLELGTRVQSTWLGLCWLVAALGICAECLKLYFLVEIVNAQSSQIFG